MLDEPLSAMPEKGVEQRPGTRVVATLPRADTRDVLLMRRDLWSAVTPNSTITILSSSPRRSYNLTPFLASALPVPNLRIEFIPVRGNVPTRLRKLIGGEHHGLVVAKAALDRLLTSPAVELESMRAGVRAAIDQCRWMILPVSENPTGAAQGALAMEIATDGNAEITALVQALNDETTFVEATREREILRAYGGGCHQKIGVTVLSRDYGTVVSIRGLTDEGQRLDRFHLESERKTPRTTREKVRPCHPGQGDRMFREPIPAQQPEPHAGLWIARAEALPDKWTVDEAVVWTAGLRTWKRLAARGVWVNGSADGLGERENPCADVIAGRTIAWLKLIHDRAEAAQKIRHLATYQVSARDAPPDLSAFSHFFWTSGNQFLDAIAHQPEILGGWHACGPGNSWTIIRERLGSGDRLEVWLSEEAWRKDVTL